MRYAVPEQQGSAVAVVTGVAALGGRVGVSDAARGAGAAGPVGVAGRERAGLGCRRERVGIGLRLCRLCGGKIARGSGGVGTGWRVGPVRGRGGVMTPCAGGCRCVGQPTGEQCGNTRGSPGWGGIPHSVSTLRGGALLWPITCWCVCGRVGAWASVRVETRSCELEVLGTRARGPWASAPQGLCDRVQ